MTYFQINKNSKAFKEYSERINATPTTKVDANEIKALIKSKEDEESPPTVRAPENYTCDIT